jgi:flagellar hook-associated protein 2
MGSPITFSGFNQIDFNQILNAIMTQESRPLTDLQTRQRTLQSTTSNYAALAAKLDTLQSAADGLKSASSLVTYAAAVSDTSKLTAAASTSAVAGSYEVVVNQLARNQVSISTSTAPDTGTTIVATGGTLTIGSAAIAISGPVTLEQLAAAINESAGAPATASIVQTSPGAYSLVLSGKSTGAANAFTIQNALTGATVAFEDTDGDGVSGDSAGDNAAQAANALVTINSVSIASASNTIDSGIPGVTLTLRKADPDTTVTVGVERDQDALANRIGTFITAYNDIVKFANDQLSASGNGSAAALGRDPLLRSLRNELRRVLTDAYGSGTFTRLAEVGVGFTRTGELTLDRARLDEALADDPAALTALFSDTTTGAFKAVDTLVDEYTRSGGLLADAQDRITSELARIADRIDDMQARLAIRRAALQREFIAADQAMTRLNSQKSSLSSFSTNLSNSSL